MPRDSAPANGHAPAALLATGSALDRASSQPFLTDAQRAALDAALVSKQRVATGDSSEEQATAYGSHSGASSRDGLKSPRSDTVKTKGELMHDRHRSRQGKGSGKTKKGGAGGKFTWGAMLGEPAEPGALDKNDPNYDSDDERTASYHMQQSTQVKMYKSAVDTLLNEYLNSGDTADTAGTIEELGAPAFNHFLVKKAVTMAMDKHDREREMISALLSNLYGEVVDPEQMQKGFLNIISSIDDLKLDVPDAVDIVANFIARAVVDDCLPPSFVLHLSAEEGSAAAEVRHKCETHLNARHAAERMQRCWGCGAGLLLEETREGIRNMLLEYMSSGDVAEAARCLHGLAVPFFHHELVKQALLAALEAPAQQASLCMLLAQLSASGEVSANQMLKGFQRVADNLADTELDMPGARVAFAKLVNEAKAGGWLESSFSAEAMQATGDHPATHTHTVAAFKIAALAAITEYFDSSDAAEVGRRLTELDQPGLHNIFVKHAVQLAMGRKERERELVSLLLAELTPAIISADQLALGFTRLLASLEDLVLDFPDASAQLSLFLGRAICDELLPPSFLPGVLPALRNDSLGVSVVEHTGKLLGARHAAERLQNCWHGGGRTTGQLRDSMQALLREYLSAGDVGEAARCLADLAVPLYHHELVKRALVLAAEQPGHAEALLHLLASLAASGQVNQTQMRKGFDRVEASLDDLALDCPGAAAAYAAAKQHALQAGWLTMEAAP